MNDWYGKTVVYTSVYGGYDYIGSQVMIDGVDYFYITDGVNDPPKEIGWKVFHLDHYPYLDNRRRAKICKLDPHSIDFIKNYKYSIWIDGGLQVISEKFVPEIISYIKNGMVISPHFDNRDCAYGEATIRPPKYAKEPLDEQVAHYRNEGFPENYGLYECGVMARDMQNSDVKHLGKRWLQENITWSYQDQVSLPYVLWKTGFKPDILPTSFRYMDWVIVNAHKRED